MREQMTPLERMTAFSKGEAIGRRSNLSSITNNKKYDDKFLYTLCNCILD